MKLNLKKNSSLATLLLKIALLSKHFEDLQNFLSLQKHSIDINGISEHKISARKTPLSIYRAIHSVLMKPKAPTEEQVFFLFY